MSEALAVTISGTQIREMTATLGAIGKSADGAIARAVNHTGDKAKTAVTRALTTQTGLKRKTIVAFLKVQRASAAKGTATYALRGRGGNISLKYFGARETQAGVSAAPLGKRMMFAGTFMKAGGFTKGRVTKPKWNGQVFRRAGGKTKDGEGMDKFEKVRSGVYLAEQLVEGASAEAFRTLVATDLPARLEHEMRRVLAGQAS